MTVEPIDPDVEALARAYDAATMPSAWGGRAPASIYYQRRALLREVDRLRAALADANRDRRFLNALYAAGVDSWEGYQEAVGIKNLTDSDET